jgi:3D (Asp-Asp-Asp) domain-containing protein/Na+-transporting methylmalonyl-CoA/oxaloacetate decarboxylase gamma subunit
MYPVTVIAGDERTHMSFIKYYWKNCWYLAIVFCILGLLIFYMTVIPANAVIASGTFEIPHKAVGGIQIEKGEQQSAKKKLPPVVAAIRNPSPNVGLTIESADGKELVCVGTFKVVHYCHCTLCTNGTGITASGEPVQEGMVAADWNVLPMNTVIYIKQGDALVPKVVKDRGGAINGNKIDIYVPSHEQAIQLGTYYADIYVAAG